MNLVRAYGSGLGTMDHDEPFQCSISVLVSVNPTDQTSVADAAAMPCRKVLEPETFGLCTTAQDAPSQCSMSGRFRMFAPLVCRAPTAHASLGEIATTPSSVLNRVLGLGVW